MASTIAVILGSARHGRRCEAVAGWAADALSRTPDLAVDWVDPMPLPWSLIGEPLPQADWQALEQRLEQANGFVVVTPEYHGGYPAVLKQLIDAVPDVWADKPLGFVSYGWAGGGARAVAQLTEVLSCLRAVPLARSVCLEQVQRYGRPGGGFLPNAAHRVALAALISELQAWPGAQTAPAALREVG